MEQRFLPGMSPALVRVAEAARKDPNRKLLSLAHHLGVDALRRAYERTRANAAVGIDGMTKEAYGENLEDNLQDLHCRLKTMRYRHRPIRRVYIDKEGGKRRPIGISCLEDKIVQDALRELLEAIYEQDFRDCSYGFRPGRSAHDALRALDSAVHRGGVKWILEADIVSFFDQIDRSILKELLQQRIADRSLMRLVGKCLHVGILDAGTEVVPETGTTQGSTLSPLLANIYLHHVLDTWFEQDVVPRMHGHATLIRYCDDFILGFEFRRDAERVRSVLGKRLARFGLTLHPEKTRLIEFRRPWPSHRGKAPPTFDFLGFTHLWKKGRKGTWYLKMQTRRSRQRRASKSIHEWCRRHRHLPVKTQHAALVKRIQGHFNYFGIKGNGGRLHALLFWARRSWFKWLNRRGQRSTMTWKRFNELLVDYPLPQPSPLRWLWASAS